MLAFRIFALFAFSIWLSCGSAQAERRVALVIGNSAYKSVPRLANPANDAALVGGMFKRAGFDWVDIKTDLGVVEMRRALREFGGRARDAEVAVIYYAGHGIEQDGINYLIPTDAALETDSDVLDETVALDRALFAIEPAKQLRLVILDACRDSPFIKFTKRTMATRSVGRGLARVEPTSPNTMIAFAAKAGSTVADGDSKNSPFSAALVERLPTPGLDVRKAFGFVRDDVLKNTGYKQEPYVYGSLGGDDFPLVAAKPVEPQASPDDAVRRDYELALQIGTQEVWSAFLAKYTDGFYASMAKGQLNRIAAEEARAAAAEKSHQEEEKTQPPAHRARSAEQDKAALALADRIISENAAAGLTAKQAAEKQTGETKAQSESEQKIAALAPISPRPILSLQETARLVQSELRRVGCLTGTVDGDWNVTSQQSLTLFNKFASSSFDTKLPSSDVLDAIKAKAGRVCPLPCRHGFKNDGDGCARITCRAGYRISEDNECEKVQERKPVAAREPSKTGDGERNEPSSVKPGAKTGGQIVCNDAGCRSVRQGCRLEAYQQGKHGARTYGGAASVVEVCN